MEGDALAAEAEELQDDIVLIDPTNPLRRTRVMPSRRVELLRDIVIGGRPVYEFPSLENIRTRRKEQLAHLHESYRRLHNAHEYKVGLTHTLWQQKEHMLNDAMV
jgi:nicotinate phosphoribosyltransferase